MNELINKIVKRNRYWKLIYKKSLILYNTLFFDLSFILKILLSSLNKFNNFNVVLLYGLYKYSFILLSFSVSNDGINSILYDTFIALIKLLNSSFDIDFRELYLL